MKSLFKILLVLAIFICQPTNAFSFSEKIKPPIIENSMTDSFIVNPLGTNFVYLNMEKENTIKFANGSVVKFVSSDADNAGRGNTPFKDYFDEVTELPDEFLITVRNRNSGKNQTTKHSRLNILKSWEKENPKE